MKILILSDVESKYLWDYFEKEKLEGIDLILSCGDLKPQYLSFLASFSKVPILYVRGNHDDCYKDSPPEGCICIEDKIYVHKGIRIMGLGGSIRYKNGDNQYTESQMKKRVAKMWPKIKMKKGIDILLTHSPAAGICDGQDNCHKGFEVFIDILEKYKPKYFIHGHVHKNYARDFVREQKYNEDTVIINGYDRYILDYPEEL
ncbi:MAG: metallophosphoesterase [Eubacteriales bacterium]|nr:metallophosphoesterase [Eubacteriales bacterium]